jgi:hypothetical protein
MALSELTRRLVERHCRRYCGPVCPPSATNQVRLSYRIAGDDVWICELRPLFRTLGMHAQRAVPLAQLRFDAATRQWTLRHATAEGRSRPYPGAPRSRDFLALLREFDRDPCGLFWQRVNGASLRWCSSRGRCRRCDLRYRQLLGDPGAEYGTPTGTLRRERP